MRLKALLLGRPGEAPRPENTSNVIRPDFQGIRELLPQAEQVTYVNEMRSNAKLLSRLYARPCDEEDYIEELNIEDYIEQRKIEEANNEEDNNGEDNNGEDNESQHSRGTVTGQVSEVAPILQVPHTVPRALGRSQSSEGPQLEPLTDAADGGIHEQDGRLRRSGSETDLSHYQPLELPLGWSAATGGT